MNSYKKYLTMLLYFLLVLLYTYYLSQGEYGTADLVMTIVSMLLPLVSASMYLVIIWFVMNRIYDKKVVLSSTLAVAGIGYIVFLLFYPLKSTLIFLLVQKIHQIFSQYTRGIGESKKIAINGIITFLFNVDFNILFLVRFMWEMNIF